MAKRRETLAQLAAELGLPLLGVAPGGSFLSTGLDSCGCRAGHARAGSGP